MDKRVLKWMSNFVEVTRIYRMYLEYAEKSQWYFKGDNAFTNLAQLLILYVLKIHPVFVHAKQAYLIAPRWSSLVVGPISLTIFSESVVSMENVWNEGNLFPISQSRPRGGSWWYVRWYTVRIFAVFVAVPLPRHFFDWFPVFSFSLETTYERSYLTLSHCTRHLSQCFTRFAFVSAWIVSISDHFLHKLIATNFYWRRWILCCLKKFQY